MFFSYEYLPIFFRIYREWPIYCTCCSVAFVRDLPCLIVYIFFNNYQITFSFVSPFSLNLIESLTGWFVTPNDKFLLPAARNKALHNLPRIYFPLCSGTKRESLFYTWFIHPYTVLRLGMCNCVALCVNVCRSAHPSRRHFMGWMRAVIWR